MESGADGGLGEDAVVARVWEGVRLSGRGDVCVVDWCDRYERAVRLGRFT